MEVDGDAITLDRDVVEESHLGQRAPDLRVGDRPGRSTDGGTIDRHHGVVPTTPASGVVPTTPASTGSWEAWYARLRWASSSFSNAFSLLSTSTLYSRAMLPPTIFRLISSVRSTPYSALRSSGNWKAMKSSSCQCGYQIGKSVP